LTFRTTTRDTNITTCRGCRHWCSPPATQVPTKSPSTPCRKRTMPEATGQLALEQTTCHEVAHSQSPSAREILSLFLAGWRATLRIMILDPRSRLDRNSYGASSDVDSNSAPSLLSGASHSTHRWKGLDRRHHSVCGVAHLTASGVDDGVCGRNAVDLFSPGQIKVWRLIIVDV